MPETHEFRRSAARRGRWLELFTIGWNSLEALVAIAAGIVAGSVSLVGFGMDSVIEVTSGAVLLWRMAADHDESRRDLVEHRSLAIVGWCFIALAVYVAYESAKTLWFREPPHSSVTGIVLAAVSLVVMPILTRAKRKVAVALNSTAMRADSKQTEFCAYLSAILLGGLALNAILGWWWADPVAALLMAPIIANEGRAALVGKHCVDCS